MSTAPKIPHSREPVIHRVGGHWYEDPATRLPVIAAGVLVVFAVFAAVLTYLVTA